MTVPSNLIPVAITGLPLDPAPSDQGFMAYTRDGNTYKVQVADILSVSGVPATRQVIAGTGLSGGGQLTSNVTLSVAPGGIGSTELSNTGVAAGVYGSSSTSVTVTVDAQGRITAISTSPISVSTATNISGGAENRLVYQTAVNATGFVAAPVSSNTFLKWNGSALVWDTAGNAGTVTSVDASGGTTGMSFSGGPVTSSGTLTLSGTLGAANGGTGLSAYTSGDLVYASGSATLAKLGIGASTRLLTSSGSAPQWSDPAGVTVGTATTATNVASGTANQIVYNTASSTTSFITAPTVTDSFLKWNGSAFAWSTVSASGTVTSIDVSGGTTGLTTSGGPVTTSGTITIAGTLAVANGGTGITSFGSGIATWLGTPSSANLAAAVTDETGSGSLVFATSPTLVTPALGVPVSGDFSTGTFTWPTFNQNTSGTAAGLSATLAVSSGGTGATTLTSNNVILGNGTSAVQFVAPGSSGNVLTSNGTTWTSATPSSGGTVTSVALSVPTGFAVSGSPVTTSGTLALAFDTGYSLPTTTKQTEWDTAYTDRLKWDGGSTGLNAATGRTSLGGTTAGQALFTLTNPSAITFLRVNADNSVSALSDSDFRTAIGAGTGNGTVTSIVAGTYLTGGTITTSGTIAVDATSANTVSKVVARDSSGNFSAGTITANLSGTATTATNLAGGAASQIPYQTGSGATSFIANGTAGQVLVSAGASVPAWGGISGGTF